MSMRQIIVLGVAALAAIAALFLVRGMASKTPEPAANQAAITNGVPVLVASKPLQQGDTAAPGDLAWVNFPAESLSENYIQKSAAPTAMQDFTGAVARFNLEKGEPVTAAKMVKPGSQGFMAAILTPGYRAIAVPITQESAAAGFILPNDHVDVIMTRKLQSAGDGPAREDVRANIILEDVRVLAIDGNYKAPVQDKEPAPMKGAVATLELTPEDAETLAMAHKVGDIALALRGARNEPGASKIASAHRAADGGLGLVRIHRFGNVAEASVKSSAAGATP